MLVQENTQDIVIEYLGQRFFISNIAPQTIEALQKRPGLEIIDCPRDDDDSKTISCDLSTFLQMIR